MKNKVFIPVVVAAAIVLPMIHVLLIGEATSLSFGFMEDEAEHNVVIVRAFAVVATVISALVVCFPVAYFSNRKTWVWPLLVSSTGFLVIFAGDVDLLKGMWLEVLVLIVASFLFWHLGVKFNKKVIEEA